MARVTTEIVDHVAHVTLTRGDKMNGVDQEMAESIVAAGDALIDNADVRAVVLSGEGRAFCAGLDVASFAMLAGQDPHGVVMPRLEGKNTNLYQEVAMVWRRVPVPVIASLHGVVFGAGFQLALGADVRICHPETKLAVMEMKWGLVPDMGGMVLMPEVMRSDVIRRMTYTAEPVDGAQALDWGVVTEVSENPLEAAKALASTIAGKSPSAIRAAKRLIDVAESGAGEDAVLIAESQEQSDLIGKPHQMEVIAANMQKRAPKF
ncbi:crotonase/enoyl-CoA hydratase family protein [Alisedimentitalea sp. MJ-SS2]|uniref:crotonase/enoyl-CoA hydratase family protein n=1 Tax=Aliisedimentitalea sp. MJ-SS2 TaxID=3049795 RepID=UPI0029074A33|nr:crotonase/enoyl-CoA hydratase family protein [Alisedimentitalea sp. MJ-SS2]MDU8928411.1 crotonase/enoyl-CoA hydratase family protein [Alisedimentitalea sp. MJ-SS2]